MRDEFYFLNRRTRLGKEIPFEQFVRELDEEDDLDIDLEPDEFAYFMDDILGSDLLEQSERMEFNMLVFERICCAIRTNVECERAGLTGELYDHLQDTFNIKVANGVAYLDKWLEAVYGDPFPVESSETYVIADFVKKNADGKIIPDFGAIKSMTEKYKAFYIG